MTSPLLIFRQTSPEQITHQWPQQFRKSLDPSRIIHVYRGLLRATTYLPDSVARAYAYNNIKSRFRSNRAKAIAGIVKSTKTTEHEDVKDFTIKRLRTAVRSLHILERAGQGNLSDLKKVLFLVHGRKGERKRVLLKDLLQPDESSLPKDDLALKDLINSPDGTQALKFTPDAKFLSFLKDQQAHQPRESHKGAIRTLRAKIPKENIWGRPMPLKLADSMRRKWWASTLDKVLPPIPQSEWDRLRDLAKNRIPLEEVPPRRLIPKLKEEDTKEKTQPRISEHLSRPNLKVALPPLDKKPRQRKPLTVLECLNSPARVAESDMDRLEFDPDEGLVLGENDSADAKEIRQIRDRSMRRLYSNIWSMTSTMKQDKATNKWIIEWGGELSRAHEGEITQPSAQDAEFFEGVDQTQINPGPIKSRWALKKDIRKARKQQLVARTA